MKSKPHYKKTERAVGHITAFSARIDVVELTPTARMDYRSEGMDDFYAISAAKAEFRDGYNIADTDGILNIVDSDLVGFSHGQPSEFGGSELDDSKTRLANLFERLKLSSWPSPQMVNRQRTRALERKGDERGEIQEIEFIPHGTELGARSGNAQ